MSRLIDADALMRDINDSIDEMTRIGIAVNGDWLWAKLNDAIANASTIDAVEVVRCGKCRHYQGNHDVPGCAPCAFWGIGEVMWDDFCKRGERND